MVGWGADLQREDRPGVPRAIDPPQSLGSAHWTVPEQQVSPPAVVSRRRGITPVYGTANPPRALSGVLRRVAYGIPEYKPRRWMLLMIADRVDVLEHTVLPTTVKIGALAGLGVAVWLGVRALRA
jgi:hypothetical protein